MEEVPKHQGRRLTKKQPPALNHSLSTDTRGNDQQSLRKSGSLQRMTSAPYPRSQANQSYGHARKNTSPNTAAYISSSSSSLDRIISGPSPILQSSEFGPPSAHSLSGSSYMSSRPLIEQTSQEFVGAPFDSTGVLTHIDSTKASGYQNSLRRPPPPPLSHTSPDPRMISPSLRQSASFSSADRMSEKGPRVGDKQSMVPKRYSDETRDPKSSMIRKKSGFSTFMKAMGVGSPGGVKISAPENPVHVTHVGYDSLTGQFTVSFAALLFTTRLLINSGSTKRVAAYDQR